MGKFLDEPSTGGKFLDAPPAAEIPRGEGDKATSPTTPEGIMGGIFGAGQPESPNMIQSIGNAVLPIAATMPATAGIIGAGGGLAARALPQAPKLAGAIGRVATSGALGAAESGSAGRGLVDAGLAGAFEAGLAGITRAKVPSFIGGGTRSLKDIAEQATGRRGAFDKAGREVGEAFDAIKPRIEDIMRQRGVSPGSRWLNVPALGANRPMTLDEVKRGLMSAEGATFDAARKQVHRELMMLDKFVTKETGRSPYSAIDFNSRAAKERFTPKGERGEKIAGALSSPFTRSVGDAIMGQDEPVLGSGLPIGLAAPIAAEDMIGGQRLGNLAQQIIRR